jgi:hypothetical protein
MSTSPARNSNMRATLRQAAKKGRGGDDRIAHINGYEAAVLKSLGGAGTINPATGLREYAAGGAANRSEGGLGPTGDGPGTGGGRGANGGQGGRGGGAFGNRGTLSQQQDRINRENARRAGNTAPGVSGRGGQTFEGQNVPGNPSAPGYLDYDSQTTTVNGRPVKVGDLRDDYLDYQGLGDTFVDQIGNFLAGTFGFQEDNPFGDDDYANNGNPTGRGANWSFDPVPGIVGLGSMIAGIPAGPGYIAGLISNQLNRPLSIDLGPSALTSDRVDPDSGQVVGSNTTHTGPSVTVRDNDDPNTYYGLSEDLAALAGGASNTTPKKQTFVGTDPAPVDGEPEAPYQPVTPQPSQIDTPPAGGTFDPGNTQLSPQQLSDLFVGYMNPGRTARGRSSARLVV